MLQKPKQIYNNPWYIITSYGDYDLAENLLYIPDYFMNFHTSTRDCSNIEELISVVKEIFDDYLDDAEYLKEWGKRLNEGPIYLYVIPFWGENFCESFSELLENIDLINIDNYHLLVSTLPKQQLITLNYTNHDLARFNRQTANNS